MRHYSRKHILLSFLSGCLITMGIGTIAVTAFLAWIFSRMFTMGVQMPKALLVLLFPLILIILGLVLLRSALQSLNSDEPRL